MTPLRTSKYTSISSPMTKMRQNGVVQQNDGEIEGNVDRDAQCALNSHGDTEWGVLENCQDVQDDCEFTARDVTSGRIPELQTKTAGETAYRMRIMRYFWGDTAR